jgi:RHS repeat-associated protein
MKAVFGNRGLSPINPPAAAIYIHGPNTDEPLMRQTGSGPGSPAGYYHHDGLGSVIAMTNAAGTITGSQRFDAWGNDASATGAVQQYGYTGREPDGTGLIYYRARYYDPTVGRFLQKDPIGLQGGLNQYAYVGNNPVNFVDPSGLTPSGASNNSGTSYPVGDPNCIGGVANASTTPRVFLTINGDEAWPGARSLFMYASLSPMTLPQGDSSADEVAVDDAESIEADKVAAGTFCSASNSLGFSADAQNLRQSTPCPSCHVLDYVPGTPMPELQQKLLAAEVLDPTNWLLLLTGRVPSSVMTPRGPALQALTAEANIALREVQSGATVFRQGEFGVQNTVGGQFWALRNPSTTPGYAGQFGMPGAAAPKIDWMMGGTVRPGSPVITRPAPGIGGNPGGSMEAVVPPGGVSINWFHMP